MDTATTSGHTSSFWGIIDTLTLISPDELIDYTIEDY